MLYTLAQLVHSRDGVLAANRSGDLIATLDGKLLGRYGKIKRDEWQNVHLEELATELTTRAEQVACCKQAIAAYEGGSHV